MRWISEAMIVPSLPPLVQAAFLSTFYFSECLFFFHADIPFDPHSMGEDELLDVCDENGQLTGVVKPRKDIHKAGDWHQAVHVWIVSKKQCSVLLQQRVWTKKLYPGRFDISSAGHVQAGQTPLETAIRETEEELGLEFEGSKFEHIGRMKHTIDIADHNEVVKQYVDVYLIELEEEIPLDGFKLQPEEVLQVVWVERAALKTRFESKDPTLTDYDAPVQLFMMDLERRCRL